MVHLRTCAFTTSSLLCTYLFLLFCAGSTTNAFVLQELPIYRNERMENIFHNPRAFVGEGFAAKFGRDIRAYNFPRWNRLHSFWSKNGMLERLSSAPETEEQLQNSGGWYETKNLEGV